MSTSSNLTNQLDDFEYTGIIHILTKCNGLWLKHFDDKPTEIHAESHKEWKQFIQSQPSSIVRDWIKQLGPFQSEDKALKHLIKTNPLCCPKIRSNTDTKLTSRILNFIETIQRYSIKIHQQITSHDHDPHSDYSDSIRGYSDDSREPSPSKHPFAIHFDKMPSHWSYQRITEYFSIFGSASLYLRRNSKNNSIGSGYLYFKNRSSAERCVTATKGNRFHVEFVQKSSHYIRRYVVHYTGKIRHIGLPIRHRSHSRSSARHRSARSTSKSKKKDRERPRHRSRSRARSSRSSTSDRYHRKHKRHSSRDSHRHKHKKGKGKHIRKEQPKSKGCKAKTCVPIEETLTKQTEKEADGTHVVYDGDYTVLDYMESDATIERKPVHKWNCYAIIYWLNRVNNGYFRSTKYINLRRHICIGKVNGNQLCHLNDVTLNMIGIYDTNEIDIILDAVSELIYADTYNNVIANTMRSDNIPNMYCDPVSFELMMDPVCLDSANVYERKSIEEYVMKYGKDPLTHKIVKFEKVVAVQCLKRKIESWTHNNVITMY
eukprot:653349_1